MERCRFSVRIVFVTPWQLRALIAWRIKTARMLYDIGHTGAAVLTLHRAFQKQFKTIAK